MEQNVKRVPYGVNDFVTLIEQNNYYVDKTMYLPMLEDEAVNLFFIRPRRFGKSILLGMLHAYYDCRTKDKFQEWFGDLWIGKHPTPLQGRYQVLHLDFSQVGGTIENLEEKFNTYCCICLNEFMDRYAEYYPEETKKAFYEAKDAGAKLAIMCQKAQTLNYPLYLIIDEYDNFTNTVLNEQGEKVYWAMTHAEGFYRDVFKKFKGTFERIFITGVSPVTLDDVTSGFNIGWHISTKEEFNQMLGFSTEDVYELFTYYKNAGKLPADCDIDAVVDDMKPWYDNYCFSKGALETQSKVFNCDMVFYYLRNYMSSGHAPDEMVDSNTKTDYNKMKKLLQLDKLDGDRKGVIRTIAETGEITASLYESFPARKITDPKVFPSLLFYYGMLTIKATKGAKLVLGIPNNNVRKQYYEYLMELIDEKAYVDVNQLTDYYYDMAYDGKWRQAEMQINGYAAAPRVEALRQGTQLHKIVMQFDGYKLLKMEEVK